MRHPALLIVPLLVVAIGIASSIIIFKPKIRTAAVIQIDAPTPTIEATLTPTPTDLPTPTPTNSPTPTPSKPPISPTPTTQVVTGPPGAGLTSATVATEKGNFSATILTVNLASAKMITDTGNDSDCATNCIALLLKDFVTRNSGFAGVNGSYFCPDTYSDCASKTNSYDFPVYNTRLTHWINQDKLGWAERRAMVYTDGGGAHYLHAANAYGGTPNAAIVNYPGLLNGGSVQIDDNQSGLSDKQRSVGTKVGIGVRGSQTIMVVIAKNVNMQQFAYVFKALGADGALNLDTGGSTALMYQGRYIYGPGRNIPNAIIFANR
jgi:hypothetical protein